MGLAKLDIHMQKNETITSYKKVKSYLKVEPAMMILIEENLGAMYKDIRALRNFSDKTSKMQKYINKITSN